MLLTLNFQKKNAEKLLNNIKGLDNNSISNACKLVGYDVCYRSNPLAYRPVNDINPDEDTIKNIKIMVNRGIRFLKNMGRLLRMALHLKVDTPIQ